MTKSDKENCVISSDLMRTSDAMSEEARGSSALERGVIDLMSRTRSNGAIASHCHSRLLESALVLHLLRTLGIEERRQQELSGFLVGHASLASAPEEALLCRRVLQWSGDGRMLGATLDGDSVLAEFAHHTAARKKSYFEVLFAELGLMPFGHCAEEELQRDGIHQTWTRVILASLRILFFAGSHRANEIREDDVLLLESTVGRRADYEHNLFAGAIGLLALSKLARTRPLARLRASELAALANEDHGYPFFSGDADVFATVLSALALERAIPVLSNEKKKDARAVLDGMAAFVAGSQLPNGGWSYAAGVQQTDVDDSSYCIHLLAQVDPHRFRDRLVARCSYLLAMQGADGGFPTYLAGQSSETAMTAGALLALSSCAGLDDEELPVSDAVLERGIDYLLESQQLDGTFERSWSLSHTNAMWRVSAAFRSLQETRPDLTSSRVARLGPCRNSMLDYLRSNKNGDLGWGQNATRASDPVSTAYALMCLDRWSRDIGARSDQYLLQCQNERGAFHSISDQAGPRPFIWNVPVISSSMCVMALSHWLALGGAGAAP